MPSTSSLYAVTWCVSLSGAKAMVLPPPSVRWETCFFCCKLCWRKAWLSPPIKVYIAYVSAGHLGCDAVAVFSHPLVKRFL